MLPQLAGDRLFITDGGLETTLIFHLGLDLPDFAAFDLLRDDTGAEALRRYFDPYLAVARERGAGIVLDSATWRASRDWGERLGYSRAELADANRRAVALTEELRASAPDVPTVLNGVVGPRGDGYVVGEAMTAAEAEEYHGEQIGTFAETAAEMVSAITMTYVDEAVGIARAARAAGLPAAISFTVETDGRLPTGQPLADAMQQVDEATGAYPAYYMLNCAHPEHFEKVLEQPWARRIRGLRANASRKSHAELNESTELDSGNPAELGVHYAALKRASLPNLNVVGGCCGTDHRHVQRIAAACAPLFRVAA
jgi:S-methylmethionine-dependent homocysteine/selenocysteine methylase